VLGKYRDNSIPHGSKVSVLAFEVRVDLVHRDVLALSLCFHQRLG
jgi:hypothetical protein